MQKVTVLYNHPEDEAAFEAYYAETHMPIAGKMDVARIELTKFGPGPDGSKPEFHRMAEMYFNDQSHMAATLGSPAGEAAVADLANFATGGVKMLVGSVQE